LFRKAQFLYHYLQVVGDQTACLRLTASQHAERNETHLLVTTLWMHKTMSIQIRYIIMLRSKCAFHL